MKGGLEKRRQDWQRQLIADTTLALSDLKVAVAITWYFNRTTGEAFPAMATLAKETGYCERTIIRSVKRLEARGHLYVKRDSRRGDRRGVNRYVPILKPAQSSQRPQRPEPIVAPCHPPRDTYVSEPRDTHVSLEPLNRTTELTTILTARSDDRVTQ
jgi:Helix-turn-helix domain